MPDPSQRRRPSTQLRVGLAGDLIGYARARGECNRSVRLFLAVTVFRGMVIATLRTVLNLYLYSLGYDARCIGIITGVNALAVLGLSLPLRAISPRDLIGIANVY